MKKTVLLSLLIIASLHSQPKQKKPEWEHHTNGPAFNSQVLVIPDSDSSSFLYYTYRIPYNRLVFIRSGKEYSANLRVTVELIDGSTEMIERDRLDEVHIQAVLPR